MRKSVIFSMGFGIASIVLVYGFGKAALWILAILAGLTLLLVHKFTVPSKDSKRITLLLLGILMGACWMIFFQKQALEPIRHLHGQCKTLTMKVTDAPRKATRGNAVECTTEIEGRNYKLTLYLDEELDLKPGNRVMMPVLLQCTVPEKSAQSFYFSGKHIFLLGYQQGDLQIIPEKPDVGALPAVIRQKWIRNLETSFLDEEAGFAKALVLGDKQDISAPTREQFSISGISHIIAVSGLHVSMLFGVVFLLSRKIPIVTAMLGIPIILLYAAIADFTPSVTRAALMESIMIGAMVLYREYDSLCALASAGLIMMIRNPFVIGSLSFQLSFSAVAGIILCYPILKQWFCHILVLKEPKKHRILYWTIRGLALTLSASIAVMPLIAYYFGTISLIAPVANLLIMGIIGIIFTGTLFICIMMPVLPALCKLVSGLTSVLIRYVFAVTESISQIPGASCEIQSLYLKLWVIFGFLIIIFSLKTKENKAVSRGLICAVLGLAVAQSFQWMDRAPEDYQVTALDVGQGQCVILECDHKTYIVDCGGDYGSHAGNRAAQTLKSKGIHEIEGLILTHYDQDHVGGTSFLADKIRINGLYIPHTDEMTAFCDGLSGSAMEIPVYPVSEQKTLSVGDGQITIFPPDPESNGNESSLAVLFQKQKYDTLITGDMSSARERSLLEKYEIPDLEVLVVGHHGSAYSTSEELLYLTAPDVAMISAGYHNTYGHPAPQTLARLEVYGCAVYRTDLMGDLVYRR